VIRTSRCDGPLFYCRSANFSCTYFLRRSHLPAEWNEATFDSGQSAFSVEYDIIDNDYRMLPLESNTFCSAGGFLKNGTFISTGGGERKGGMWKAFAGWQSIRYFTPCNDGACEWEEYVTSKTSVNRWYPTVEQLPEVS
jgi:Glyoxal oxidase N-terminus